MNLNIIFQSPTAFDEFAASKTNDELFQIKKLLNEKIPNLNEATLTLAIDKMKQIDEIVSYRIIFGKGYIKHTPEYVITSKIRMKNSELYDDVVLAIPNKPEPEDMIDFIAGFNSATLDIQQINNPHNLFLWKNCIVIIDNNTKMMAIMGSVWQMPTVEELPCGYDPKKLQEFSKTVGRPKDAEPKLSSPFIRMSAITQSSYPPSRLENSHMWVGDMLNSSYPKFKDSCQTFQEYLFVPNGR